MITITTSHTTTLMTAVVLRNVMLVPCQAVYMLAVIVGCDRVLSFRSSNHHRHSTLWIKRKIAHLAAVTGQCLFQTFFDASHWTWKLHVLVPVLYGSFLVWEGFRSSSSSSNMNPNDTTTSFLHNLHVRTLTRNGRPIELCQGPLMMALILVYTGLVHFQSQGTTFLLGAVGFGDGLAPFVGKWLFPYKPYTIWNSTKTFSGSCTVFLGTMVGILVLRGILGAPEIIDPKQIGVIAFLATFTEAVSGSWDNLAIAASIELYLRVSERY